MKTTYHIAARDRHPAPKRGDLLQSNIGNKKERTWLILSAKELEERICPEMGGILTRRYKLWAERWYDLEPQTRVRLFQSAERAGGQELHPFMRFPPKRRKMTFEQYMGAQ